MLCRAFGSIQAIRSDVEAYQVTLGYQIDINTLFGLPTSVCSNQIAAVYSSSKGLYATACDSGLVYFSADGTPVPRRNLQISVNPFTQVFGAYYNYFIFSSAGGVTEVQSVGTIQ